MGIMSKKEFNLTLLENLNKALLYYLQPIGFIPSEDYNLDVSSQKSGEPVGVLRRYLPIQNEQMQQILYQHKEYARQRYYNQLDYTFDAIIPEYLTSVFACSGETCNFSITDENYDGSLSERHVTLKNCISLHIFNQTVLQNTNISHELYSLIDIRDTVVHYNGQTVSIYLIHEMAIGGTDDKESDLVFHKDYPITSEQSIYILVDYLIKLTNLL